MNEEKIKLLERVKDKFDALILEMKIELQEMENYTEVEEKVITTPEFKKLPRDLKKSTLDFQKEHKVAKKLCNKCGGYVTWDYFPDVKYPVHVNNNGIIIGNGTCQDFKPKSNDEYPKAPENTELP